MQLLARTASPAYALMHRDPRRAWAVEQLAQKAALYCSAFFDRFTRLVGLPLMGYVLAWRMPVAKDLLHGQEIGR